MFYGLFSRAYVINLKARADRRREMRAELARIGKSFADADVTLFEAVRPDGPGAFPSPGARGCFMSHLGVLADAERRSEAAIMILEDDARLAADFTDRAARIFAALAQTDWGVFYGGYARLPASGEGLVSIDPGMALQTTHCIGFNGPAIAASRRYLEAMLGRPAGDAGGGPMHVDGAYSWFRKDNPQFRTFAAAPPLAVQRSSRSDIAARRWFDRAPVVREAANFARRLLRR